MRFSRFVSILATTVALGLSHAPAALADDAADKALAATEAAMNKAKTLYFEYEAKTTESGRPDKTVGLNVWMKGEKRLAEFTAPADLKGTKVLILSPSEMYVYLPSFGKVRRIASHTSDQSAFGMAFSQGDLATQKYGSYTPAVSSSSDKEVKLTLTPRSGQATSYAKIEMTITKDKNVPSEIKYYKTEGKLVKTETRTGYSCDGDVCTPGTLKMVDHTKNLTTTLTRKKVKVNEAISDDTFSKRNLEK
ncbi:outer membrane lipoprotein-sorting protein [Sorangium sp. So ce1504]|uniref:outer membrane lipoprotein-sorting protein n=1 Tax=Sorangium sp. So ce1504 TaxID=3133337 RepID=UPI003F5F2D87